MIDFTEYTEEEILLLLGTDIDPDDDDFINPFEVWED